MSTYPKNDNWEADTRVVLELIMKERRRQMARYGYNEDVFDGTGPNTRWLLPFTFDSATAVEQILRDDYEDYSAENGKPTWVHLVREELAEAFQEQPDLKNTNLDVELIQVAALCVSWVERRWQRRLDASRLKGAERDFADRTNGLPADEFMP